MGLTEIKNHQKWLIGTILNIALDKWVYNFLVISRCSDKCFRDGMLPLQLLMEQQTKIIID
ncbi:MAG: hypothetical protein DSY83_09655 [Flavobacteriia bacterium]|nr:MAG: hypothetical protein DSY83_09655 [Flavobacteriia bacterium]